MFAARLPADTFFSHSTAAQILEVPLPWRLEQSLDIHAGLPDPQRAPHANGLRGHRLRLEPDDLITVQGLTITSPGRTWQDLATQLSVPDLVAAGDFLIHHRMPLVAIDELIDRARCSGRRHGAGRMRASASLLDPRAESRPESHLRVVLRAAGLEGFTVNHEIVATDGGGSDMRTDFAFVELKLAIEYQGDYHRSKEQWRRDMTRRGRLEEDGWIVMEINADDLRNPVELVARIRRRLALRGPFRVSRA